MKLDDGERNPAFVDLAARHGFATKTCPHPLRAFGNARRRTGYAYGLRPGTGGLGKVLGRGVGEIDVCGVDDRLEHLDQVRRQRVPVVGHLSKVEIIHEQADAAGQGNGHAFERG